MAADDYPDGSRSPARDAGWESDLKEQTLFSFGGRLPPAGDRRHAELWKVKDALEGTQIFGATGSGKTSGSGATIARAFLDNGFGGLVLTAKADELTTWVEYFLQTETQRDLADITVIEPSPPYPSGRIWPDEFAGRVRTAHAFNLLEYEFRTGGELTQNIVTLFLNALSTGGRAAVSRQDPFWDDALRELLTHAIDLLVLAGRSVNLPDLMDLVRSAPQSGEEARSRSWRQGGGMCSQLVASANKWSCSPAAYGELAHRRRDLGQTLRYWLQDFPRLNDRTRSIVVSSFTGKAAGLLRSPLRELFCDQGGAGGEADPVQSHRGRVLILHLPIKLYGEVGRFAQVMYKTIWQRATERRFQAIRENDDWAPVFLWADEAQYFITPEDMQYQMTARSVYAATVYLTQNISSYYAMMGGENPQASVDSFLGNLQTKIFHANGDAVTNQYAERLYAEEWTNIVQRDLSGAQGSTSPTRVPLVPGHLFTRLPKGGELKSWPDGRIESRVGAYVFQPGREWNADPEFLQHHAFYHEFVQKPRKSL